jgi:hypothetical protein
LVQSDPRPGLHAFAAGCYLADAASRERTTSADGKLSLIRATSGEYVTWAVAPKTRAEFRAKTHRVDRATCQLPS